MYYVSVYVCETYVRIIIINRHVTFYFQTLGISRVDFSYLVCISRILMTSRRFGGDALRRSEAPNSAIEFFLNRYLAAYLIDARRISSCSPFLFPRCSEDHGVLSVNIDGNNSTASEVRNTYFSPEQARALAGRLAWGTSPPSLSSTHPGSARFVRELVAASYAVLYTDKPP